MKIEVSPKRDRLAWSRASAVFQALTLLGASTFADLPSMAVERPASHEATVAKTDSVPQQYTLPNGLKIVLLEDHSFPVISCFVWYRVGTRNESPGVTGISHIVEHLLFQTVGHYRKGELGATIARNGGQFNGFTSDDFTAFFETISPSKLDLALRIEADRMRGATFTQADLQEEIGRVKAEFNENNRDFSRALTREVRAVAYVQHPYRNPPGGWESDLDSIKLHDAKEFYDHYFHPNNATLVIVGDFKTQSALNAVSKYFGPVAKSSAPILLVRAVEGPQTGERRVMLHAASKKDELQVAYHAPAFQNVDAPAMMVLEKLLNASISGKLKVKLVDTKICGYAHSAFELKRDPSLLTVAFSAPAGAGPQKVLDGWDSLANQLRSQLITEAELKKAKNLAEFAISSERDGPYKFAFQLGYCDVLHSWQLGANWMERLRAVTANDIMRVSKKYLVPENRVVGMLTSSTKPPAPLSTSPAGGPKASTSAPAVGLLELQFPKNLDSNPPSGMLSNVQMFGYKKDASAVVAKPQLIADLGEPSLDYASLTSTGGTTNSTSNAGPKAIWHKLKSRLNNSDSKNNPTAAVSASPSPVEKTTAIESKSTVKNTVEIPAKPSNERSLGVPSLSEQGKTATPEASATSNENEGQSRFKHMFRRFKAPAAAGVPGVTGVAKAPDVSVKVVAPDVAATKPTIEQKDSEASAPVVMMSPHASIKQPVIADPVQSPATLTPPPSAVTPSPIEMSPAPVMSIEPAVNQSGDPASPDAAQVSVETVATESTSTKKDSQTASISAQPTVSTRLNGTGVTPASVSRSALSLITKLPATILTLPGTPLASKPGLVNAVQGPFVQRKTLKNGVVVIVLESHLSPIVSIEGAVKAGSVFDPAGKKGLSDLCAHIMSNGPSKLGRPQIMQQQEDLGIPPAAMLKFESAPETINFKTKCLSRDLPAQLALIGASIKDPALQDPDVEKAKSDFYWAIKNAEDSTMTRVNRALLRSAIAPNTSYYPLDSAEKVREINLVKSTDIKDFVGQYVTPDSAVIVVAGDVSADRVFSMAEHALDGWSSAQSKSPRTFPPATESPRKLLKTSIPLQDDKAKAAISFGRLLKMPSDQKDFSTLLITDCALNSHPIFSRLMQRISSESGLSDNLSFEDMDSRFLPLSNMLSWSLTLPVEPSLMPKTVTAVQTELDKFSKTGLSAEELAEVKRYLAASLPVKFMDSTSDAAKNLLNGYFQDGSANFMGDLIGRIRNADLESVNRFIKDDFKPNQAVLILAGPAQAIKQISVQRPSGAARAGTGSSSPPSASVPAEH